MVKILQSENHNSPKKWGGISYCGGWKVGGMAPCFLHPWGLGYCSIVGGRAPIYFNIAEWDPKDERKGLFAPPPPLPSLAILQLCGYPTADPAYNMLLSTYYSCDPSALHSSIVSLISVQGVSERLNEKREQFWAACGISLPLIELSRDFHVGPFSSGCHIWVYIYIMSYWKIKLSV